MADLFLPGPCRTCRSRTLLSSFCVKCQYFTKFSWRRVSQMAKWRKKPIRVGYHGHFKFLLWPLAFKVGEIHNQFLQITFGHYKLVTNHHCLTWAIEATYEITTIIGWWLLTSSGSFGIPHHYLTIMSSCLWAIKGHNETFTIITCF